jgi:hypothetical protein
MVKLLMKPVLRCLPKNVEAVVVHSRLLNVTIWQHPRLGHALVGGETLQRIREHLESVQTPE